ncbi:MAG TPA: hypothetical protein VER17_14105, partial [Tepidisphaeraceae bacterium]|nr:hypothetical protein [Tepidisphaeraceae bacterium]
MPIEIVCRGCQAHYRVKDELAGRVAVCKHCGGKIRIPMAGPVGPVTLDDDAESAPPPVVKSPVARPAGATSHGTGHGTGHGTSHGTRMAATRMGTTAGAAGLGNGEGDDDEAALRAAADAERDFHEYGIHKQDMPRDTKRFVPKNESFLPPIVGELWMPLAVVVFCYGLTLTMAITRMLGSYAPLPGLLLVGAAVLAFVAGVIPMTIRAVTGASDTLDFKLPNAVWLQTAAAIGPATLGATLGLFTVGGAFGTLLGAGIGMGLAVPMMLAMYGVTPLQAVQTALLTALMYGMGMAGVAGLTAALGLFFFPLWNMQRPWEPAKPKDLAANTAATRPALAPVVEAAPTTAPVVEAPAPAPAVASTAPAAPAPPPRPAWAAAVDAAPP